MSQEQSTYDGSNPEHVQRGKEKQKVRYLRRSESLKRLLSTEDGRFWMWNLLSICGVYRSSFSSDALVMAFNEGRRDIGNQLIAEICRLDGGPELYMRMATENRTKIN